MARRADEKKTCDVSGCKDEADRSISAKKVGELLKLDLGKRDKKAHLCKEHYKEYRKATKKDRKLDTLGRN